MKTLAEILGGIRAPDAQIAAAAQARLDAKTKPRRSLGRLETLACRLAAVTGKIVPPLPRKTIVVMAADHGVAQEGVSAYPREVTAQMVLNFLANGAAINVLARHAGAELLVVDMGVATPVDAPGVLSRRMGEGTANFTHGPAMSRAQATAALEAGAAIAANLAASGVGLIGLGEMGIGNTTAASALTAALTGAPAEEVTGHGTGIDHSVWTHKVNVIRRGLAQNRPDPTDPLDVLAKMGGFEIAGLAGVALGAAAARVPVVIDGFIAGVAALVAARLAPELPGYLIAAHRSIEVGHRLVLGQLKAPPLLDLDMRLGEGTGAALAMGLVDASLKILHEMATFADAGVSDSGR